MLRVGGVTYDWVAELLRRYLFQELPQVAIEVVRFFYLVKMPHVFQYFQLCIGDVVRQKFIGGDRRGLILRG